MEAAAESAATALAEAREEARACRRCSLWRLGTQTVYGAGPSDAPVMLVGEQPGDREDVEGLPFVGPAGQLLDRALAQAGVRREALYLTNAVKHFKNEPRGKRRLHVKPSNSEIDICKWWLDVELKIVRPRLVVALGVSAARGITGRTVRIMRERGTVQEAPPAAPVLLTVHPSMLLRLRGEDERETAFRAFVADLAAIRARVPEVGA